MINQLAKYNDQSENGKWGRGAVKFKVGGGVGGCLRLPIICLLSFLLLAVAAFTKFINQLMKLIYFIDLNLNLPAWIIKFNNI